MSEISKFYKLSIIERQQKIAELCSLNEVETKSLVSNDVDSFENLSENVIGQFSLPLSIATNFLINGKDYLIPMVTEESSVVAAASKGAKIARIMGGFTSEVLENNMIGQIQIIPSNIDSINQIDEITTKIIKKTPKLIKIANSCDSILIEKGGGGKSIEIRTIDIPDGKHIIIHLIVNTLDAMGANTINTMLETIAQHIEREKVLFSEDGVRLGQIGLKILSNLANRRIVRASATFSKDKIGGERVVKRIMNAYNFALADPYRAATHNKGIMNGICAIAIATGNDTRALESGAHAFAATKSETSKYSPLTKYSITEQGDLYGEIEIPLAMGTIGGIIQHHSISQTSQKIITKGRKESISAIELMEITAAVGLAQNFAALRALSDEGIQAGHMKLHKKKNELIC